MPRPFENLAGRVFGRLVVLDYADSDGHHAARYKVRCECGQERIVPRSNLISGNSRSCGCIRRRAKPERSMDVETAGEQIRREWAEHGGDWAFQILKFLQGRRVNEVSLSEVEATETFARSDEREKAALLFVAADAQQRRPLSEDDRQRLRERDDFLVRYADGKTLGHSDWVAEIKGIPFAVKRAQEVDAGLFVKTYAAPILFRRIWGKEN